MDEDNKDSSIRPNNHKRNIQPQQQKWKGVARIINGPKKNAIVKWVNAKAKANPDSEDMSQNDEKPMNVYDRLYNSRKSVERNKIINPPKSAKKIPKTNHMMNHKTLTPSRSEKKKNNCKNYQDYTGYVFQGHRSRELASNRVFSLTTDSRNELEKIVKKREPTPVAHKEKPLEVIKKYEGESKRKNDNELLESDDNLPHFASENRSLNSKFSDNIDSHPLTEFDDFEASIQDLGKAIDSENCKFIDH